MQSALSINTKPRKVQDWQAAKQFLTDLNPTIAVVGIDNHSDFNLILEAQQAAPNTKIVARFIDKDHDGSMHLKPQTTSDKYIVSPLNQLDRTRAYGKNSLTAYFGNEPDTKASIDDLNRLADHTIEAMDLAANRDFDMSLTVLNLGVGHPQPVDGYLPTWMHPILVKLNEHRNRHFYGLHTYLPADVTEHLNALKKTCIERLHIPLPRIIITETGYDAVGDTSRNGFKTRGISNEDFAHRCVSLRTEDLKAWIDSGEVLGFAVFMYGDDASWFSFNVETSSKPGEVSTAWRDTILRTCRAGELMIPDKKITQTVPVVVSTVPVKDVVYGELYRLSMPGKIVTAYAAPSTGDKPLGTIPDAAVVEAGNKVTVDRETWLQVKYPSFNGYGWIKIDLITMRETMTNPVVKVDSSPAPAPTPDAPPDVPKTPPVVAKTALDEKYLSILYGRLKAAQDEVELHKQIICAVGGVIDDKRETLADVQHEIWSSWMQWVFKICPLNADGTVTIPAQSVTRWQRQIATPYSDLTEKEKDSDREQADKVLSCIS